MAIDIQAKVNVDQGSIQKSAQQISTLSEELKKSSDKIQKFGDNPSVMKLQSAIAKTREEATRLVGKMQTLLQTKVPTDDYLIWKNELNETQKVLDSLNAKLQKQREIVASTKSPKTREKAESEIAKLEEEIRLNTELKNVAEGAMREMRDFGEAFRNITPDDDAYKSLESQLNAVIEKMKLLGATAEQTNNRMERSANRELDSQASKLSSQIQRVLSIGVQSFSRAINTVKRAISGIISMVGKIGNAFMRVAKIVGGTLLSSLKRVSSIIGTMLTTLGKVGSGISSAFKGAFLNTKKTQSAMDGLHMSSKKLLTTLMKYGLGVRSFFFLFRRIRSFVTEGFSNILQPSYQLDSGPLKAYANAIYDLKGALETLKYSITGAFLPLVTVVVPYIQRAVEWISSLISKIGQLIGALLGQKTYMKAVTRTGADVYKSEQKQTKEKEKNTKATKKNNDEKDRQLSSLDKLNNMTSQKEKEDEDAVKTPDMGAGAGGGFDPSDYLQESPIEDWAKRLAEKIKEIFEQIMKPIKEAWAKVGDYVKNMWKYALHNVKSLLLQIGRDFLEAWKIPEVEAMWEHLFLTIGNVLRFIGNLAAQITKALRFGKIGVKIWEDVFRILDVIWMYLDFITASLADWAGTLNFIPLFSEIEHWLKSLLPLVRTICGIALDFVETVIEPLGTWVLSPKGLPRLFKILTQFNKDVKWTRIRMSMRQIMVAAEKLAEVLGNKLLDAFDWLSKKLSTFLNSGWLQKFANDFTKLVDAVSDAEDLHDVLMALFDFSDSRIEDAIDLFNNFGKAINDFLGNAKFGELGKRFAESLNKIVEKIDFKTLGSNIGKLTQGLYDFITNAIKTVDWVKLGEQLKTFFGSMFEELDFSNLPELLGKAFQGLNHFIHEQLSTIDWDAFATDLVTGFDTFLDQIDFKELGENAHSIGEGVMTIFNKFVEYLGSADFQGKLSEFLQGLNLDGLTEQLKTLLFNMFMTAIKSLGNFVVNDLGLTETIIKAVKYIAIANIALSLGGIVASALLKEGCKALIRGGFTKAFEGALTGGSGKGLSSLFSSSTVSGSASAGGATAGASFGSAFATAVGGIIAGALGSKLSKGMTSSKLKDFGMEDTADNIKQGDFGLTKQLSQDLDDLWNLMNERLNSGDWSQFGTDIIMGLVGGMTLCGAAILETCEWLFDSVVDGIKDIFGIHSPAKEMNPLGENILLGVLEGFKSKFEEFTTSLQEFFDTVIAPWFTLDKWNSILQGAIDALVQWKDNVFAKFEEFKTNLETWFNENILPWFTLEKWTEIFQGAVDGVNQFKEQFIEGFNQLKEMIKVPINAMIGFIEGFINSVISGLNGMFSMINSIGSQTITNPFNGQSYTLGVSLPTLSTISIPRLATGTVIPPSASEFMAMLGDNNTETEVVSPLSTMTQAFRDALSDMNFGGSQDVSVQIDGETLFKITQDQATRYQKRTGYNAFA